MMTSARDDAINRRQDIWDMIEAMERVRMRKAGVVLVWENERVGGLDEGIREMISTLAQIGKMRKEGVVLIRDSERVPMTVPDGWLRGEIQAEEDRKIFQAIELAACPPFCVYVRDSERVG